MVAVNSILCWGKNYNEKTKNNTTMRNYLSGILFFLISLLSIGAMGAGQVVYYVDLPYILKNLPQYETANEQLTIISRRWQKEVDEAKQKAEILASNFQTEQIFMSDEMKKKREAEIVKAENAALELKRKYFGQDGELFKKREALLKPIQDEIYAVIQDIATERKIDVVKDRAADKSLLYMSSKLDMSDDVLAKLGIRH